MLHGLVPNGRLDPWPQWGQAVHASDGQDGTRQCGAQNFTSAGSRCMGSGLPSLSYFLGGT
jgi:hypothetical protein